MGTQFLPGDVVEIETDGGLRHVQITHSHQAYPEILRAFLSDEPGMKNVVQMPTTFTAMFPLAGALERGSIKGRKIGTAKIPDADREFPTFKMPVYDKNGGIAYWWFWDGESLRYDAEPEEDLTKIPQREVLTIEAFVEKLMRF